MKRILSLITAAAILFAAFSVSTFADAKLPDIDSLSKLKALSVYSVDSMIELYGSNENMTVAPGATVKLMTAILALEHFDGRLDETITVGDAAVKETVGTSLGLIAGETLSVKELLTALIVGGANDAALVFAHEIAGSTDEFCKLMNEKAKAIGADDTVYKNPCGIDADGMKTTASDTAKIAVYAYKLSGFKETASITRFVMSATNKSGKRVVHNRNYLLSTNIELKYYDSCAIGMNTGYTANSGFCTVSAAEKDGLSYIFVVLGGIKDENGDNSSFYAVSELISETLGSFGYVTVLDAGSILRELPVALAKNVDYVTVAPEYKVDYFLPLDIDISTEITYEPHYYNDTLTAPIHEGQQVGSIDIIYKGETISTVPIVTVNNVSASSFLRALDYLKNLIKSRQIRILLIVFAVLFSAYLMLSYIDYRRRRKKR